MIKMLKRGVYSFYFVTHTHTSTTLHSYTFDTYHQKWMKTTHFFETLTRGVLRKSYKKFVRYVAKNIIKKKGVIIYIYATVVQNPFAEALEPKSCCAIFVKYVCTISRQF